MQTLSVTEFDKRLREDEPRRYVFDTDNQDIPSGAQNARWREEFYRIRCMINPNRISFLNDNGSLTLENVRYVCVEDENKHIGEVLRIVCSDLDDISRDVSFLLLADKIYNVM